jgi:hypothetical protein
MAKPMKRRDARHSEISAGVVGDTIERMKCLPEGWLQ